MMGADKKVILASSVGAVLRQRQDRSFGSLRPHRGTRRRFIYRANLYSHLYAIDPQCRWLYAECHDCLGADFGRRLFHLLWLAFGQDRPQADHHVRLPIAALTYFPIFERITTYGNPALAAAL